MKYRTTKSTYTFTSVVLVCRWRRHNGHNAESEGKVSDPLPETHLFFFFIWPQQMQPVQQHIQGSSLSMETP